MPSDDQTIIEPLPLMEEESATFEASRYLVLDVLGVGGVGKVFRALDRKSGREVALKTIRPSLVKDSIVIQRFLHEGRLTAQLSHPNIIPVYDLDSSANGLPFYTMPIVRQQSLHKIL